ncbi:hypothetical protein YB2330_005211 [Saitoella coloradoensis]
MPPIAKERPGAADPHYDASGRRRRVLTARQIIYLGIQQFLINTIVAGGINFGIATAMYRTTSQTINVWPFPNTLAGDACVTVFITGVLIWLTTASMVIRDLRLHNITPIPLVKPNGRIHDALRWMITNSYIIERGIPFKTRIWRVFVTVVQGALLGVVLFGPVWGIGVGILSGIYGCCTVPNGWAAEVFKLIFGGIDAGITAFVVSLLMLLAYVESSQQLVDGANGARVGSDVTDHDQVLSSRV